ncbi:MAG TPA: T9SS type A sorting domain-containing protein [Bacteroidales bacterium]|nr:T9SS type A sorting domain-containing protein [Bacteroidales bacterium]
MKNLNALKTIVAVFLMIPAIMLGQVPDIKMNAKMKPGEPNYGKVSGKALLYEQLNNPSDEGINSQQYPDFPDYSCEGADDFIVPAGESWTIDSVVIYGFYNAGGGVAGVGNVHFFQNDPATNLPGVAVNVYNNIVVNSNLSGDLTIVFTSSAKEEPPVLAEGQYWMSVQVNMSFTESGQWYWRKQLAPTILNELAWRNPGGGFGVPGSESWLTGSLVLPGSIHHNLSFGLYGTTASVGGNLIFAGQDLWTVPCGTFRFGETGDYPPLPADFFGPGSEPFEGTISLIGENSNGSQNPVEDLIVQRLEEAEFLEPYPFDVNVPIEIIQLALKSKTPVQVSYPGFADSFFDVYFIINFEQPALGSDLITKEHDFGGTFTKEFGFYPFITFVDVDDPSNLFVFDPFTLGYSQLNYNSSDFYEWTLSPISGEFDPVGNDPLVLFSAAGSYLQIIPLLRRMDHAWLDMSENGQPLVWEGTGYADGEWFYYPNTEWWNVWFYDHPIAPERRKIINGIIIIEPRLPDLPSYVEIVFNWSTPEWPGFPEIDRPPLPSDVTDPQIEQMMIVRSEPLFVFQGNIFEPIQIPVPFEILEYNPEWLSIDLRGYNFILMADIDHTCWIEGDCTEFGNLDFGDAPEGSLAYTNGVNGQFPTCLNAGTPGSYISHVQPSGLFFGGMVDTEGDGNAGTCPMFHPNNYNVDECGTYPYSTPPSNLLDEGLMYPASYTIVGTSGNEQYVSCSQQTLPLGSPCGIAVWGQDIDIWVDASQSQGGYLNVLFDWDQNGVWMGASSCQPPVNPNDYVPEHAVQNLLIPAGFVGPVSQLSPPNAFQIGPNTGYVWARFSLTDQQVALDWDGAGVFETGETEDYLIEISGSAQDNMDFGDNPDPNYPTLLANDGARHIINPNIYMGSLIDAENDGQPTSAADGDDLNNLDDEDGVTFTKPLVVGKQAFIKVKTSASGYLNAWIDFNQNGTWADAGDQILLDIPLVAGINNLNFAVPAGIKPGSTYSRFRFNTAGGLTYYGPADDGEVEDYHLIIHPPDWGFIPSANTHLIAIPASVIFNCISLVNEDFIGTFYTNDGGDLACGGAIMWDGINNQAVIAYGDDVTTTEKDGFNETEVFTWKVYHSASGNEETVSVLYDPLLPDYDGKFHSNGLSGLISINKPLIITAIANPDTICAGDPVQLDVVVTGGCGPLSYSWSSVPAGFTSSVKNPVALPVVTTTYYVTVSTNYGDSKTSSVQVVVHPLPQVDCPPFMTACEDDPPVLLNNSYPLGGVYNGTSVYYDGVHYWFDPSIGTGTYLITYCVTDPVTNCTNCCEFNFIVHPKPVVECPDDMTVCIDTDPFDLTGATPPGGNYSGTGVSGGVFYPDVAGAGDHVITYTYTDPQTFCTNFCEFIITVIEVIAECPDDFAVCLDNDPVTLTGGSPAGGTYAGPGVSADVFYPSAAGVGVHILTYTWVFPGTNCFATCEFTVEVYPLPQVDCPADFSVCLNSRPVLLDNAYPLGGEYIGQGIIFNGGFYYFDPSVGPGTYLITYCFTDPVTNCTQCCEFFVTVVVDHLIEIPQGWSGISSYIVPDDPLLDNMLYPIMNELIILQNLTGVYWPAGNMNTLINWNEYSGYAIKVSEDVNLPVCGIEVTDKSVNLSAGWNMIPVLSTNPVDIAALFNGVNGFQVAKEVAGYGLYWPAFGINTIGVVKPGKAYYVRMSAPGSIDYSSVKSVSSVRPPENFRLSTPWNDITNTPGSHIVVFNLISNPFENGDIIGGFTNEGICSGISLVENTDSPFAISLNGNDPFADEKVGFENGEMITFRLFRPSTGEEFSLEVSYNPQMSNGIFEINGMSEVTEAKTSSLAVFNHSEKSFRVYPNPNQGLFTIEGTEEEVDIFIWNALGNEVFEKQINLPANIDLSSQPKGVYLVKITYKSSNIFNKLIVN